MLHPVALDVRLHRRAAFLPYDIRQCNVHGGADLGERFHNRQVPSLDPLVTGQHLVRLIVQVDAKDHRRLIRLKRARGPEGGVKRKARLHEPQRLALEFLKRQHVARRIQSQQQPAQRL